MRTPKERREEIINLPTEELQRRVISPGFGDFNDFAKGELASRIHRESCARTERVEEREGESLSIARSAARSAKWAAITAIIAVIIAVINTIIMLTIKTK